MWTWPSTRFTQVWKMILLLRRFPGCRPTVINSCSLNFLFPQHPMIEQNAYAFHAGRQRKFQVGQVLEGIDKVRQLPLGAEFQFGPVEEQEWHAEVVVHDNKKGHHILRLNGEVVEGDFYPFDDYPKTPRFTGLTRVTITKLP